VKELAVDGVPVAVTCRVLKLARQPYYRWLDRPVADAVLEEAYRANALFDAHRDDPEFGYRFLADEARGTGAGMADRTAWRICRDNRWWSVFGKKRGRGKKAGPPVHDDLVSRNFTATGPNRLWLTDITEHATAWIPVVVATVGAMRRPVMQPGARSVCPSPGPCVAVG
jgi:transposase InsO family protein